LQLPEALIHSLRGLPGFDEVAFLAAHDTPAPVSIRFNASKLTSTSKVGTLEVDVDNSRPNSQAINDLCFEYLRTSKVPTLEVPWCPNAWYLPERPVFTLDPSFHGGAYYVQEASSMFVHYALNQVLGGERGLKALDLCAAPGGKTTLLASMPQIGLVVANEIIRTRVSVLYENVVKWGDPKIFISNNDPADVSGLPGYFDLMLVDAPCSGSGLFRKDADAMNEWSPGSVQLCAGRQQRILADSLPALKEGGVLVYSTCSYSPQEDEEILDWLMAHALMEPIKLDLPETWGIVETMGSKGGYGYRFFPHNLSGEGFFISCFRLLEGTEGRVKTGRTITEQKANIPLPWYHGSDEVICIQGGEDVYAIPADLYEDHLSLRRVLNMRKTGIRAGAAGRKDFIPDHEWAMSTLLPNNVPSAELTLDQSLQYLRKENFTLEDTPKGWLVMRYNGLSLGLVKNLGNRLNNYYPAAWRILMS
jgi:16S rRNA C967 or C1407 C5-methylase (RsmB/RsmF family)/NOL1/NOP2/fmu family ribosome biogenesis protein